MDYRQTLHLDCLDFFLREDTYNLALMLSTVFPNCHCLVSFVDKPLHPMTASIKKTDSNVLEIVFSRGNEHVFAHRWTSILDLLSFCRFDVVPKGYVEISLADSGTFPELHFCGNSSSDVLIPDCVYLETRGYGDMRRDMTLLPWADRKSKVFWRGSSTGRRAGGDWRDLPRFKLCQMSKSSNILDCALTEIVQATDAEKEEILDEYQLVDFVNPTEFGWYKYHIDIDGNTNAWSGLFHKLLSGAVVLKVNSPWGFRQWYYDRLIPWVNFVPIREDLQDLADVVERLEGDQQLAKSIGYQGRQLALSLDYGSQLFAARDRVERMFLEGADRLSADGNAHISYRGDLPRDRLAALLESAIERGRAMDGKLPHTVLSMDGMSGRSYRVAINNLVASIPNARYLEIGSWAGSTACSAMHGNRVRAVCIDDWSGFGGPKDAFLANVGRMKGDYADFELIESDFRQVDYDKLGKFNVYLFDGPHQDQLDGLMLPLTALDDEFIFITNDWNWDDVRANTRSAIEACGLKLLYSIEIRTTFDNSHPSICRQDSAWHNGCFLSVLKKKSSH